MTKNPRFGEREWMAFWRVQGRPTSPELYALGRTVASKIGMTVVNSCGDLFPHESNSKGGVGNQIYFCWTESFMVLSSWPDLNFFRVYIASCKKFDPRDVSNELREVGPILQFEVAEI